MIHEAIILAGGLGTRLRNAIPDLPKCMAPVAGKPFLSYVIDYFHSEGIEKFILALGYKADMIEKFIGDAYPKLDIKYSLETEPLGTGGAIKLACKQATEKNVLILNGDTFFKIALDELSTFHKQKKAECSLSLAAMYDFDRYGVVRVDGSAMIKSFEEKKYYASGLINGGVYALQVDGFLSKTLPDKFSFEKDYLEKFYIDGHMFGLVQDRYFIDIGIPEDYHRAQAELLQNM